MKQRGNLSSAVNSKLPGQADGLTPYEATHQSSGRCPGKKD